MDGVMATTCGIALVEEHQQAFVQASGMNR
jgi:hypothetical protein